MCLFQQQVYCRVLIWPDFFPSWKVEIQLLNAFLYHIFVQFVSHNFFYRLPITPAPVPDSGNPLPLPLKQLYQNHQALIPGAGIIPRGDKDAILNSIVETYHNQEPLKQKNKNKKAFHKFSKYININTSKKICLQFFSFFLAHGN